MFPKGLSKLDKIEVLFILLVYAVQKNVGVLVGFFVIIE